MGADLIGYILVGPIKINKKKIEKCIREVSEFLNLITRGLEIERMDEAKRSSTPDVEIELSNIHEELEDRNIDCGSGIEDGLNFVGLGDLQIDESTNPRTLVQEFVSWWEEPSGRDRNCRIDPYNDKRQIVFAGEMSWGDTPSGEGYTMINQAMALGIVDALGIR